MEMGNCLMATEFQFYKMNSGDLYNTVNILNITV